MVIYPEAELPPDTAIEQILILMASGEVDRLVGALRKTYPDLRDEVEDAIHEAISRLMRRRAVQHPGAWIYKVASNHLLRAFRDRRHYSTLEPAPQAPDPAEIAQGRQTLALIKRIVDGWENAHIRVVTMLYIEPTCLGEPLSLLEAQEHAATILGEEISIRSISTWKARGFERLVEELTKMNYHIKREKDEMK